MIRRALASATTLLALAATSADAACLPASGHVGRTWIRGVQVGAPADFRDGSGAPVAASAASYCVDRGGQLSFALDHDEVILLVTTTAPGDRVRDIAPGAPLPKLAPIGPGLFRLSPTSQIVVGATAGRITFLAAVDRLLLENRGKLNYWLHRLGF